MVYPFGCNLFGCNLLRIRYTFALTQGPMQIEELCEQEQELTSRLMELEKNRQQLATDNAVAQHTCARRNHFLPTVPHSLEQVLCQYLLPEHSPHGASGY